MRCPDCNKFVSFEEQDPEVNSVEIDEYGNVMADVRIVNACDQCSNELTESSFNTEVDMSSECEGHTQGTIPEGDETEHELSVDENGTERTQRSDGKPGTPSRYRRNFYGYRLDFEIRCSCGKLGTTTVEKDPKTGEEKSIFREGIGGSAEDEVQASGMDSLV